jgi:hypothetical protein
LTVIFETDFATIRKVPESTPGDVTEDFFCGIRQLRVPGVDSASKNEYRILLGVKAAGEYC